MSDLPFATPPALTGDAITDRQCISGLLQNGQLETAKSLCTELCARSPEDADAWFLLGAINGQSGNYSEAADCCRKVISLQPSSAAAYSNLGSALLLQEKLDEAETAFSESLNLNQADPNTHNNLGNLLRALGRSDEAAEHYRKALALDPGNAEACNNLGGIFLVQGRLEDAREQYEKALQLQPAYPDALNNLAMTSLQMEDFDAAKEAAQQVLRLLPGQPQALITLGNVYRKQGEAGTALEYFTQALEKQSNDPELLMSCARIHLQQGSSQAAAQHFRQAAAIKPEYAEAWNGLGRACMNMGKLDVAANAFRHALSIDPELAEAHINMASLLTYSGRSDKSISCCDQAIKIDPDNPQAWMSMGYAHKMTGEFAAAEQDFSRAEQLLPGYAEAIAGKASVLDSMGKHDEALALLRPLVETGTESVQTTVVFAEISRHTDNRTEAIELLENLSGNAGNTAKGDLDINFSLGKLYDDTGNYEAAFEQFSQGNSQLNDGSNPDDEILRLDAIRSGITGELLNNIAPSTNSSERPVFIVGMPRSGTSLVEQILASHPDVFGAGELLYIADLVASLANGTDSNLPYPDRIARLSSGQLDDMAASYLEQLNELAGNETRVTDKMPYNFMHLGLIQLMFPNARVIHCSRDPLDTCLSCFTHYFVGQHAYSRDLTHLGRYYRKYKMLMNHWSKILQLPILEVSYEELVADQEKISRNMVEFCGLEWDPACLEFHTSKRHVLTSSYNQVRRPIYKSAMQRWKNYESQLGPLIKALDNID